MPTTTIDESMRRIAVEELEKRLPDAIRRVLRDGLASIRNAPRNAPRAAKSEAFAPGDYLVHFSYGKVTARCRVLADGRFSFFGEAFTSATAVAAAAAKRTNQKSKTFGVSYWKKVTKAEWDRAKGTG